MFIHNFIFIFSLLFYIYLNFLNYSYASELINKEKIIIIGDSISCDILKNNNNYNIKNYCKVSSGLVSKNFYNWYNQSNIIFNNEKITNNDFIIILLGTNDNFFYNKEYKKEIISFKNYIVKLNKKNQKNIIFIQSPNSFSNKLKNIENIRQDQNFIFTNNNYIRTYFDKEDFSSDLIHIKNYNNLNFNILSLINLIKKGNLKYA